jgi:4-amino-4-deoxy-L-arabinose transferase-like glycosyltransferase
MGKNFFHWHDTTTMHFKVFTSPLRFKTAVQAWLLLCLLAHVLLATQLGLSVDEAHYALYALHPALSYFDHPPLVGWLQLPAASLSQHLGAGAAELALRLLPLLCWALTAWALLRWSVWGALLFSLSPLHHLLGLALVPDTLLMPLTVWVFALCLRIHSAAPSDASTASGIGPVPLRWWLTLGLALGLAGLAKYTAVLLALGVGAFLLFTQGWRVLRERGLWVATAVALLCTLPVLWWNAQHDWISLRYQLGHAGGEQAWKLSRTLAYASVQVAAVGALPLWGLFLAWLARAKHDAPAGRAVVLPMCLGLPLLLLAVYLSGRGSALPHWTAPAWVALLPLAAWGFEAARSGGSFTRWGRRMAWAVACIQALQLAVLASLLLLAGTPMLPKQGLERNPLADLYGWRAAGEQAQALAKQHQTPRLALANWTLASRLAWYAQPLPVHALDDKNQQFKLWFGDLQAGDNALFVNWSQMPFTLPLSNKNAANRAAAMADGASKASADGAGFKRCTPVGQHAQPWPALAQWQWSSGRSPLPALSQFDFYLCQHWHAAP